MNIFGTPKTLRDAIAEELGLAPDSQVVSRLLDSIQDRLAQSFGTVALEGSAEQEEAIHKLWGQIFKDKTPLASVVELATAAREVLLLTKDPLFFNLYQLPLATQKFGRLLRAYAKLKGTKPL